MSDDMRITVGELLRAAPCEECHRRTRDVARRPSGRVLCWRCWELTLPP